jgi:hypothetical protein
MIAAIASSTDCVTGLHEKSANGSRLPEFLPNLDFPSGTFFHDHERHVSQILHRMEQFAFARAADSEVIKAIIQQNYVIVAYCSRFGNGGVHRNMPHVPRKCTNRAMKPVFTSHSAELAARRVMDRQEHLIALNCHCYKERIKAAHKQGEYMASKAQRPTYIVREMCRQ